jgi:prophage regulatory protein
MSNPDRILRLKEVLARVGLSRSTVYAWMKEGKFPAQVKLGRHLVGWSDKSVSAWLNETIGGGQNKPAFTLSGAEDAS